MAIRRETSDNVVMSDNSKIRIFWTNHGYYSQEEFTSIDDAVAYVRTKCFEAAFHQGDNVLAAWSPISGLRKFRWCDGKEA